ncbi:MAG: ferrous iron transport protein B [Solirubrobacteraceae bacterium]
MRKLRVAIIGNPNSGKTTLFNFITKLSNKTGNYSGVTIEASSGFYTNNNNEYELIDFPGIYSIYPNSIDEKVVLDILNNPKSDLFPDKIIFLLDANNLKRGLLLYEQLKEYSISIVLVMNFIEEAKKNGFILDLLKLEKKLNCSIIPINKELNNESLNEILHYFESDEKLNRKTESSSFTIPYDKQEVIALIKSRFNFSKDYFAWQFLINAKKIENNLLDKKFMDNILQQFNIVPKRLQVKETLDRYNFIDNILEDCMSYKTNNELISFTQKFDKIATHPIFGYALVITILLFIFQMLYNFATIPMDFIDNGVVFLTQNLQNILPAGLFTSLLTEAILPGIGGVLIFIPQIVLLFTLLYFLEESGYMSRVVFLLDRLLIPFGMNGKSVLPLTIGVACAVPAIMSTRGIPNKKERLITIMVTPFITCSARLPVYSILIAVIIPNEQFYGLNLQGLVFFFMYFLGFFMALAFGFVLNIFLKSRFENQLIMEMPVYRMPSLKGIIKLVKEKVIAFINEAGKVILALTIVIWVLANNSPFTNKDTIKEELKKQNTTISNEELVENTNSIYLEKSYLGILGKTIEPLIEPLGYDWKIGVAIISSLIAREVFVGTISSIYSIGGDSSKKFISIKEKLKTEVNKNTNKLTFNLASGWSLLIFYAFSMQCISTIAVVKKETNSFRWTIFQILVMTFISYSLSFCVYNILI